LFLLASAAGQLAIVAVLAGLYPAVTVVLTSLLLKERSRALQLIGLLAAAASVALIVTV
jgi:drug/metabolite transporter (DMT)-like permease